MAKVLVLARPELLIAEVDRLVAHTERDVKQHRAGQNKHVHRAKRKVGRLASLRCADKQAVNERADAGVRYGARPLPVARAGRRLVCASRIHH